MKKINGLMGQFKVHKASALKTFQLAIVSKDIVAITTDPKKASTFFKVDENELKIVNTIINELGEIKKCQNSHKLN